LWRNIVLRFIVVYGHLHRRGKDLDGGWKMERQSKTLFVAVILLLLVVNTAVTQTAAQQQVGDNLLTNPGFENGHFNQDNIPQVAVPNGWRMHWVDDVTYPGAWDNLPAYRPETVVWNSQGGVPAGEEILWRDGIYNLKIFKSWAPVWAALSQDVTGLEVGRQYRLVAPVFVDIVKEYSAGKKLPPDNPQDGQVRLGAGPTGTPWRGGEINYSGWWSGSSIPNFFLNYNVYVHDFTATSANMTVWIEMRSNYPHPNNGFFTDGIGLYALDTVDNTVAPVAATVDPNAPAPTPFPTATPRTDGAVIHVVQSGDSIWNIAIQYASTLGVPAEEALTLIQETNNNPAFISVGQELVILPPQQQAPEPTAEATATVEAETEAESEDETEGASTGLSTTSTEEELQPLATPEGAAVAAPAGGGAEVEQPTTGSVCVSAFDDNSGDGRHDTGSESLLVGAALTLSRGGATVSTYLSDGSTEMHCFEELEPDTYQIRFFPPADYRPTTQDNGWIAVSAGATMPVSFGAQFSPLQTTGGQEVAAADTGATVTDTANTPVETALVAETPASGGFFANNIGTIILGVVVFLVILAGIGVVMLRRG
jgi:hypothetical protein